MTGHAGVRILEISSYPPPHAGWGVRISFVRAYLEAQGHRCEVLNIGRSRRIRSPEYVDVQSGLDYVRKVVRYARAGYLFHTHLNGDSPKGLLLALIAELASLLVRRRGVLTFHAGPEQRFFPRRRSRLMAPFYRLAFAIPRVIICNSAAVREAIAGYGIAPAKVVVIPAFSRQYLDYRPVALPPACDAFMGRHRWVAVAYFFHRPEFFVESMIDAFGRLARSHADVGFVLVGGDAASPVITAMLEQAGIRGRTYQAGDLSHDAFMSLLSRAQVFVRTPKKDGVCSSVLEALSLGVPVVASENGSRPPGVITFRADDAADLCEKLRYLLDNYAAIRARLGRPQVRDTVADEAHVLVAVATGDWRPETGAAASRGRSEGSRG